jgi:hypothetical protein
MSRRSKVSTAEGRTNSVGDRLHFSFRRRVPLVLQTEAAECGLACLAMVAGWHGYRTDLATLRRRFSISLKGATLKQLIDIAGQMNLASRPLRLELEELREIKTPCILHWDLNHSFRFVAAQPFADVELQQGLIAGEAALRRDLLETVDDVHWHAHGDRGHRPSPGSGAT